MAHSVNITVEAPIENQIQEITYDGQEVYQAPLTISENLAKLAQKIDFSKTADDFATIVVKKEPSDSASVDSKSEEDTKEPGFQSSLWPWDSVRNKLRSALTEVCVLADVLAIAKEKRYMVLDPVPQEAVESRAMVQVYGRKKALACAATTLLNGVERLRTSESVRNSRNASDFHIDLLRLRQNWRLKKVSNTIIGDLSYRTAGSKFSQSGVFEVSKAPEDSVQSALNTASGIPGAQVSVPSALRVAVPAELEGVAFISVICQKEHLDQRDSQTCSLIIQMVRKIFHKLVKCGLSIHTHVPKDQEELLNTQLTASALGVATAGAAGVPGSDLHWKQRLEAAQNVLFCKELFARLASEAVQLNAPIPHMVVGNQIVATVLPGIQLIIGLYHSNGQTNASDAPRPSGGSGPQQKSEHDHVLEHSLHQLLRQAHHTNTHHPFPHPASGPLGPSKRRYRAGPDAVDRYELLDMSKQQTLLEQIIQQAQHFFMRRRTEYVLDTIAKEVKDPLIVSHWNSLNSPTQSCVKINIMTHGYDTIYRTSLVVHVGEKTLKCVCRDGRVMHMSYEPQELRDLIYCQIYQHQIVAVQALGRCMGWQFLAGSAHLGSGPVEPLGNASHCLLASPNGDRMISVRCEPSNGIQVSIAQSPRKDFFAGQLVQERKWEHLGGSFKEVRFDKMEGKNFLNKMELLMASLSSSP